MSPPTALSATARILTLQRQWEEHRRKQASKSPDFVDDENLIEDTVGGLTTTDADLELPRRQTPKDKAKEVRYRRGLFDVDEYGERISPIVEAEVASSEPVIDEAMKTEEPTEENDKSGLGPSIMNGGTVEDPVLIEESSEIEDVSQLSDTQRDGLEETTPMRRRRRRLRRYAERNAVQTSAISSDDDMDGLPSNSISERETWEIAPGRVVDSAGDENLAFSSAFLSGHNRVSTAPDISFNLLVVQPMRLHRFEMEVTQLRSCSIATGRVQVQISGHKFSLGTGGVFIIRPGYSCCVQNVDSRDAILHCTTIENYELSTPQSKEPGNDRLH